MEYRRPQYSEVLERMNEPRKFIQVLAGPRQVGKSTLIDQVLARSRRGRLQSLLLARAI